MRIFCAFLKTLFFACRGPYCFIIFIFLINSLQVIHARFGKTAHIVFCCFALLTNLVITIGILLAGRATIQSLTKEASDEFTLLTMAVLFGSYSLIGGLGTTFYVSYFNACLVFVLLIVFVIKIWHTTDDEHETIGNVEKMYHSITCIHGPEENYEYSYLTFRSGVALLYGVLEVSMFEERKSVDIKSCLSHFIERNYISNVLFMFLCSLYHVYEIFTSAQSWVNSH